MSKGVDTRRRMIEGARYLIRRDGLGATSIRDVWEHTRTPRGSMYFHFPGGKEQLALEVVQAQSGVWEALIKDTASSTESPSAFLLAIGDGIGSDLEAGDYTLGCAVAAIAVEMSAKSSDLARAAADAYSVWTDLVSAALIEMGIEETRAQMVASASISGFAGALTVAKASRSRRPLDDLAAVLADWVDPT